MRLDLLIRGGRVIDPLVAMDGQFDVGVLAGRVVAVAPDLAEEGSRRVVDATGLLVLPGLIDLHAHVFHRFTYWGVDPDTIAPDSGVTTWVDAGSSGSISLGAFREHIVKRADVRIKAFMNVSYLGLVGPDFELCLPEYLDDALIDVAMSRDGDLVAGIKVRMSVPTIGANGLAPLRFARKVADRYGVPLMCHISDGPPEIPEILDLMTEGDLITHCFTGGSMMLVDDGGLPLEATRRALDRGVLLDVGHGAGGIAFSSADALLSAGIGPHVISTDLHQMSQFGSGVISNDAAASPIIRLREGPAERLDLPFCMSKFLALGMSLPEVVAATTARPASVLGGEGQIGTLRPGALADVGLFKLENGEFLFKDVYGGSRTSTERLINVQTYVGGRQLLPKTQAETVPWVERVPAALPDA